MTSPKKILVIDDEEILTKTFSRLLERSGYEVYTAKNGQDAQIMVEDEKFDLIICDIRMPGLNGVETVRKIKEILEARGSDVTPVIFIAGYADVKLESEAWSLKPIAYLYKPFDNFELLRIVEKGVSEHGSG